MSDNDYKDLLRLLNKLSQTGSGILPKDKIYIAAIEELCRSKQLDLKTKR